MCLFSNILRKRYHRRAISLYVLFLLLLTWHIRGEFNHHKQEKRVKRQSSMLARTAQSIHWVHLALPERWQLKEEMVHELVGVGINTMKDIMKTVLGSLQVNH